MKKKLQNLGKALMNPVAVLPLAALLMGVGYAIDPTGWGGGSPVAAFFIKSGAAILDNLGLIFAVGLAYGLSKDKNGAASLSGLVAFLTLVSLLSQDSVAQLKGVALEEWMAADTFGATAFSAIGTGNALFGILAGILGANAYNKFYQVRLPDAFAFFSGRRLCAIMASLYAIISSVILFFLWPVIYVGLVKFGETISTLGAVGAGIFGFFNRLLIPTGLHHALNSVFFFDLIGINDIGNFWSATAANLPELCSENYYPGMYMAGAFPIMMFGLPGAAFAMYKCAKPEKKDVAKSLLLAGALASFFTGVTEPIEFSFMFLAPELFLLHALLCGLSFAICVALHISAGFGFSAGLIDYILSIQMPAQNRIFWLIPIGIMFFFIYYFSFKAIILKKDLKTPGREDSDLDVEEDVEKIESDYRDLAEDILTCLGGKENIDEADYCITRIRTNIVDPEKVDEEALKKLRIAGVMRPDKNNVQVVIGPQVQAVYDEFRSLL